MFFPGIGMIFTLNDKLCSSRQHSKWVLFWSGNSRTLLRMSKASDPTNIAFAENLASNKESVGLSWW